VRPPIGLVAKPTANQQGREEREEKIERDRLRDHAGRGNTLPNMLSARLERAADEIIARHYTFAV